VRLRQCLLGLVFAFTDACSDSSSPLPMLARTRFAFAAAKIFFFYLPARPFNGSCVGFVESQLWSASFFGGGNPLCLYIPSSAPSDSSIAVSKMEVSKAAIFNCLVWVLFQSALLFLHRFSVPSVVCFRAIGLASPGASCVERAPERQLMFVCRALAKWEEFLSNGSLSASSFMRLGGFVSAHDSVISSSLSVLSWGLLGSDLPVGEMLATTLSPSRSQPRAPLISVIPFWQLG
jgi:hypothetical protein